MATAPTRSSNRETLDFRGCPQVRVGTPSSTKTAKARDERWKNAECTQRAYAMRATSRCTKDSRVDSCYRAWGLMHLGLRVHRCCCCCCCDYSSLDPPEGSVCGRSLRLVVPPVLRRRLVMTLHVPWCRGASRQASMQRGCCVLVVVLGAYPFGRCAMYSCVCLYPAGGCGRWFISRRLLRCVDVYPAGGSGFCGCPPLQLMSNHLQMHRVVCTCWLVLIAFESVRSGFSELGGRSRVPA